MMPFGDLPLAEDDVINLAWAYCRLYYTGRRHSCCLRSFIATKRSRAANMSGMEKHASRDCAEI